MITEDLLRDLDTPLLALKLIVNDIECKLLNDWEFFSGNNRSEAFELEAYISVTKGIIKHLLKVKKRYNHTVRKEYAKLLKEK